MSFLILFRLWLNSCLYIKRFVLVLKVFRNDYMLAKILHTDCSETTTKTMHCRSQCFVETMQCVNAVQKIHKADKLNAVFPSLSCSSFRKSFHMDCTSMCYAPFKEHNRQLTTVRQSESVQPSHIASTSTCGRNFSNNRNLRKVDNHTACDEMENDRCNIKQ